MILRGHKVVNLRGQHRKRLVGPQAVVAGLTIAVFNALHQPGLANLDILVQVRPRDGQKFHPLQQRIGRVLGLFKHTPVELHPGVVPAVEKLGFCVYFWPLSGPIRAVLAVYRVLRAIHWGAEPNPGRAHMGN